MERKPNIGDIVVVKQRIGVIRYYGDVDFDTTHKYYGIELKGKSISGRHTGAYNENKYFTTKQANSDRIFLCESIRTISSEELIDKLIEIHNINNLYDQNQLLKQEYLRKCDEINSVSLNIASLKHQKNKFAQKIYYEEIKLGQAKDKFDKLQKHEDTICMSLMRNTTNSYRKSHIENRHILCVIGFVRKYSYVFVHNDVLDIIIFFYSKTLVMKLSYEKIIKYSLICPICDEWSSIEDKIKQKYSVPEGYLCLRYGCRRITVDAGNWDEFEWNEQKLFVVHTPYRDYRSRPFMMDLH
eukprot:14129_1